ncbi:DNA-3-methyladenine glycosylase I [Tenacibaculum finnmarkense]|uniref:DNA-3-methyladenine glycosylase I n=1 Tax=Tenacibaculum finnmarkense genomovar ulcerans TaxID=2781388 RepID=A0A2I2M8J7_9FLAO|nr:DNA-3-methyladenine glycosylase I [Tenacibaculum finnmarkense]MBE7686684.1 DNA-3-methyladenine glycosylase I [Tenacibaculum finnmarkense genomovar ulcerans]MBE7696951.1 DNA-3-methyladenine glycosylase I [Tenacibaculum finnmarkense genomovar ulcerans]MCD8409291.1 DNA-3-methyladenine glycosylase I [Tenacibaculum finnmarkense genomovar ulcerans]MCG8238038.1 DNA-3-methyladenine glycosylase I [Tenacibaculum finnmarkense genomovar ulcerans]MCG8732749.1 DNA-3-methyladenine glycosylase I [Tenacibac
MKKRCLWVTDDLSYIKYHDTEWGVPVYDDAVLFEFLILESFQAGLSWVTILKKRENFRLAFDNFDYTKIANYDEDKYQELLQNKGIIRHKLKIKSAILNAKLFMEIQKEFGSFSTYIWSFVQGKPIYNNFKTTAEIPAKTVLSTQISTNLKKRGFKFVGDTIMYAYMQAIGMVNDHTTSCFKHPKF